MLKFQDCNRYGFSQVGKNPAPSEAEPCRRPRRLELAAITELPATILALRERMLALALNSEPFATEPDAPGSWPTIRPNAKSRRIPSLLKQVRWHIAKRL